MQQRKTKLQLSDSKRLSPPPANTSPITASPRGPPSLSSPPRNISPLELFSVFTRVNYHFFRCSVCGNRVKADSNSIYLFPHTFACRHAICEEFLKDDKFRRRLAEILFEIKQTQDVESQLSHTGDASKASNAVAMRGDAEQ